MPVSLSPSLVMSLLSERRIAALEAALAEERARNAKLTAECFPRSLAAPSLVAKIIVDKYCDGLPLHRIEDRFARDGFPVDRGTMCRWVEDAGATVGATVLAAEENKDRVDLVWCLQDTFTPRNRLKEP